MLKGVFCTSSKVLFIFIACIVWNFCTDLVSGAVSHFEQFMFSPYF